MQTLTTLLPLAGLALTMAGFAAVVSALRPGAWSSSQLSHFQIGMTYAGVAFLFCFVPTLINIVIQDTVTSVHIGCAILGVQIILHGASVLRRPKLSKAVYPMLLLGLFLGLLQFTAFTGWGVQREFDLYQVGLIWHLLQAAMMFGLLVWAPDKVK